MPAPVVIDFLMRGMPDLTRALRTVEQAALAAGRAQTTATQREARARTSLVDREARDKVRVMIKADQETRRIQDRAYRETERMSRQRARDAERAGRAEERAAERAANVKMRVGREVDREIRRLEKDRARENERLLRDGQRLEERAHQEQLRAMRAAGKEREKSRQTFARAAFGGVATGGRAIVGGVSKVAGMVGQLGGGFSIADSVKEMGELEKSSVMFSNAAYMGKGKRIDPKALQNEAKAAAILTGVNPNELMQGAHAFLAKTGNAGDARASMKLFGEIATGTGAKIEDVAKAAGTLKVQNNDLTPENMKGILLQTVRQGQKGSIEFSDLAGSVGKITRTATGYVGDQGKTQAELLGIAQLGMATMSDPRDVATSLAGVESDTKKHWRKMGGALGAGTFDNMGRITKGPSEFIASVMEKTNGDTRKLQELGFGKQAMKYFQALAPDFQKAGGGKAGKEALLTKMKDAVAEPMGYGELQTNVKNILDTSAMQFETSMTQLKVAVGERLMPELLKIVPLLRDAIPVVGRLLDKLIAMANWASSNPFNAIGAILTASVTKSIVEAQIGDAIKRAILGGGGAGGMGPGGLGGAAGGGGALAMGAVVAGSALQYKNFADVADVWTQGSMRGSEQARGLTEMAKGGGAGAEVAQQMYDQAQKNVDESKWTAYADSASKLTNMVNPMAILGRMGGDYAAKQLTGQESYGEVQTKKAAEAQAVVDNKELIAALKANTTALQQGTAGGGPAGKPAAASGGIMQRPK